jgi:hypothetical protein
MVTIVELMGIIGSWFTIPASQLNLFVVDPIRVVQLHSWSQWSRMPTTDTSLTIPSAKGMLLFGSTCQEHAAVH